MAIVEIGTEAKFRLTPPVWEWGRAVSIILTDKFGLSVCDPEIPEMAVDASGWAVTVRPPK